MVVETVKNSRTNSTGQGPQSSPAAANSATNQNNSSVNPEHSNFATKLASSLGAGDFAQQVNNVLDEGIFYISDSFLSKVHFPLRVMRKLSANVPDDQKPGTKYHQLAALLERVSGGKFGIKTLDKICDQPGEIGTDLKNELQKLFTETELKSVVPNFYNKLKQIPNIAETLKKYIPKMNDNPAFQKIMSWARPQQEANSTVKSQTTKKPEKKKGILGKLFSPISTIKDLAGTGEAIKKADLEKLKKEGGIKSMLASLNPKVRKYGVYGASALGGWVALTTAWKIAKTILWWGSGAALATWGGKKLFGKGKKQKAAASSAPQKKKGWRDHVGTLSKHAEKWKNNPLVKMSPIGKHVESLSKAGEALARKGQPAPAGEVFSS